MKLAQVESLKDLKTFTNKLSTLLAEMTCLSLSQLSLSREDELKSELTHLYDVIYADYLKDYGDRDIEKFKLVYAYLDNIDFSNLTGMDAIVEATAASLEYVETLSREMQYEFVLISNSPLMVSFGSILSLEIEKSKFQVGEFEEDKYISEGILIETIKDIVSEVEKSGVRDYVISKL